MPKKKIEVVELNKKESEIILEETPSALVLFWRRHGLLLFSLLLTASLLIFGVSLFIFVKNLNQNVDPVIKEVPIEISLTDADANIASNNAMTDETARDAFANQGLFESKGEVLLVKKAVTNNYTIKYFSDGTALRISKDGKNVVRINPLKSGEYGLRDDGIINTKAVTNTLSVTGTKNYPWGTVTYYNDNSAEVTNSKQDMFVRNASDIHDNYISDNKVSYLKETKNAGNTKLNYYYDGTVEVVKNGTSYLVRNSADLDISGSNVTFKNNNQATIYETKKLSNGFTVNYYTDGGAIVSDGNKTISVRKSNSIKIKNNKLYEIVDNIYVTESKKTNDVTYYTNGGAVVNNQDGKPKYVPENSQITYDNNDKIKDIGNKSENLIKETNVSGENVKTFEETAVVKTDDYTAILPKEEVMYDPLGKVKDLDKDNGEDLNNKSFTITNNTNELIHYRVIIEESKKTTINSAYLRYQLSVKEKYIAPKALSTTLWQNDKISKSLNVKGTNYILVDNTLDAYATDEVTLMLWADYDTIPNSQMNKYFYGTIRVYAWTQDEE